MISRNALDVCSDNEWWHIEGFETAVFSPETWHLHHKIGAYCNRPHEVLKEMGLYYDRPYNELVFLSPSEHMRIHVLCRKDPFAREALRRKEMENCYKMGYPIEPWMLSADECLRLENEMKRYKMKDL